MKFIFSLLVLVFLTHSQASMAKVSCAGIFSEPRSAELIKPEYAKDRLALRGAQVKAFDPLLRALRRACRNFEPDFHELHRSEVEKLRYSSYAHLSPALRTGARFNQPVYVTPSYLPGIQRGTRSEIIDGNMFSYMRKSGAGNSYFMDAMEGHLQKAEHYIFRLEKK